MALVQLRLRYHHVQELSGKILELRHCGRRLSADGELFAVVDTSFMGGKRYFGERRAPPSRDIPNASVHRPRLFVIGLPNLSSQSCLLSCVR
ncbi:hypothetical protein HBI46_118770 [Parastagonospora nodorum]|nr:hypothetical protein HBI46_118770 [Parastagonospora nodorum]